MTIDRVRDDLVTVSLYLSVPTRILSSLSLSLPLYLSLSFSPSLSLSLSLISRQLENATGRDR
jgi:hypothetical protein